MNKNIDKLKKEIAALTDRKFNVDTFIPEPDHDHLAGGVYRAKVMEREGIEEYDAIFNTLQEAKEWGIMRATDLEATTFRVVPYVVGAPGASRVPDTMFYGLTDKGTWEVL